MIGLVPRNRRVQKDEAALKTRPLLGFMMLWIYFVPLRFESLVFRAVEAASFLAGLVSSFSAFFGLDSSARTDAAVFETSTLYRIAFLAVLPTSPRSYEPRHQALIPQNCLVRLQHLRPSWLVSVLAYL